MTASEEPFRIAVEGADPHVVRLSGELDIAGAPALETCLLGLLGEGADVVIDLSQLSFLESTGIGTLIGAHKAASERRQSLVLRGAAGQVARVLAISGVDQVLTVDPSTPAAG